MLGYVELYQDISCHIIFMPQNNFLTVKKVAKYLVVHPRTVYRLIKAKKLKATNIGGWRITHEDLQDFIKQSTNTYNEKRK